MYPVDIAFQIDRETALSFGCRYVLPAMPIIMFRQRAKTAGMRPERHVRDNIHIGGRKERVTPRISAGKLVLDNFLGSNDPPPGSSRHHQIVPMSWRDDVTPAVRLHRMEDRHIGTDRLRHDDRLAGVERILLN